MKRVLLVTNIPNPYRIPLFNELHRQLERQDIQLRVLFAALGYRRRKWMLDMSQCCFEYDVLSSRTFEIGGDAEKTIFTYGGLFQHLRKYHPDAVVVAGFSLATLQLWLNSWIESLPYIIWTGSVKGVWTNRAGKRTTRSLVRTLQRKAMVSRAAGFVAYGSSARTYLIDLGVSPEIISIGISWRPNPNWQPRYTPGCPIAWSKSSGLRATRWPAPSKTCWPDAHGRCFWTQPPRSKRLRPWPVALPPNWAATIPG